MPLPGGALAFEEPLCASLDGLTLHAATRAGGEDDARREALLRYVLRPPLAQDRLELRDGGPARIARMRSYADRTLAVEMDPLSLLARLAASRRRASTPQSTRASSPRRAHGAPASCRVPPPPPRPRQRTAGRPARAIAAHGPSS